MRLWLVLAALMAATPARALPVATAEIVHEYPHDPASFTEGLLFLDGALYESTGYEGQSVIRRETVETGQALNAVSLAPGLFGEGIVAWNGTLLSVTWHSGVGFRWSLPALKRIGRLRYAGEGWAMTNDGRDIVLSDGTPTLRVLDPRDFHVIRTIKVTANGVPLRRINELEYVDGELLANIWLTNEIARIDPASGKVMGWIDLTPLTRRVAATDSEAVPNGIAYDERSHRLFVTGKDWPILFEIGVPAGPLPALGEAAR